MINSIHDQFPKGFPYLDKDGKIAFALPKKAFFNISGTRRMGRVLKVNNKTMWVKVMIGAKSYIHIKRHIEKHKVRCYNV
ncbi:MAG: hypothetical protein ACW98X_24855 [Promethearchaeota archaeon]|jgi:hypothetical protein